MGRRLGTHLFDGFAVAEDVASPIAPGGSTVTKHHRPERWSGPPEMPHVSSTNSDAGKEPEAGLLVSFHVNTNDEDVDTVEDPFALAVPSMSRRNSGVLGGWPLDRSADCKSDRGFHNNETPYTKHHQRNLFQHGSMGL